jgi:hypothetical protein
LIARGEANSCPCRSGVGVSTAADYGISIDEFNADDYGPKALAWCKADIETERRRCAKSKADMIRISENARLGQSIDQDGVFPLVLTLQRSE